MTASYLKNLNERQREAVLLTDGPLLVLAGAGSGKTKMLTSRIAHLIREKGILPYQVLAVTFTNKAAKEMKERVSHILNADLPADFDERFQTAQPDIGTFHSICVRILRRESAQLAFTKPFVIYDDSDQLSLIKSIFKKLDLNEKATSPKSVQYAINDLKNSATEASEMAVSQFNFFEKITKRVYEVYEKELVSNNALDFGEIINATYRLFRDNEAIRKKYQNRYLYIHVDEYQDTNRSQYLLLAQLASRRFGGHENICVVGDEDQSIYGWRGADIKNILDFERDYPGAQVVKLEQNYRSTQSIVNAATKVIKNNSERKDKTLFTENEEGNAIQAWQLGDEREEAEHVVREIARLIHEEGRSLDEVALFYRTHAQSRQFEDVLRREKLSYEIYGGLRFYDRKEIKDVLSYFKLILNPEDSVSLRRVVNVPTRGIGKTTLDKIDQLFYQATSENEKVSLWTIYEKITLEPSLLPGKAGKKIKDFVGLLEKLMVLQQEKSISELYHSLLDLTGYVSELKLEGTDEAEARIENLEEFDTLLKEFEEANVTTPIPEQLLLFLEQTALVSEVKEGEKDLSSLKMMTLHSSKGLEYPVVFMVGMEESLFPSYRQGEEPDDKDLEEERRLCYVGITRAREALYLTSVTFRRLWGQTYHQYPSRFLKEIPAHLIEFSKAPSRYS